jgi:hypothetical protein
MNVPDKKSGKGRKPDGAPSFERDGRRLDDHAELRLDRIVRGGLLEDVEQLAEERSELLALVLVEAGEQRLGIGKVLRCACFEQLTSRTGERQERATPVRRIGATIHQTAAHQPVDPKADRRGRESKLASEAALRDVGTAEAYESSEDRKVGATDSKSFKHCLEFRAENGL